MKLVRVLGLIIVVVLLLVVAVPVAVIAFLDPNDLKDFVTAQVEAQTGRRLAMPGNIELDYWPQLRLKTGAVTFSNAPGFGDEPMFAASEFQIALATGPLLFRREISLDTILLYGARVNLARKADGTTNWADLVRGEDEPAALNLAGLALGGIDIQDAAITWTDAAGGADRQVTISKLAARTGEVVVGKPIDLSVTMTINATQPALDGDVSLDGTVIYDLDQRRYTVEPLALRTAIRGRRLPGGSAEINAKAAVDIDQQAGTTIVRDLTLNGLGTEITGRLETAGADQRSVQGELKVRGEDLALLFRIAELAAAEQLQRTRDRSFALTTRFASDPGAGTVDVPEFSLQLLGTEISGDLAIRNASSPQPALLGTVTASGPDLPAVLAVLGQFQSGADKPVLAMAQSLAGLRDKSFAVDARFDTDLAAGRLDLSRLRANGLGYTIEGTLKADDINNPRAPINGHLSIHGAPAGTLLAALGNVGLGEAIRTLDVDTGVSGTTADLSLVPLAIKASVAGVGDGEPVDLTINAGAAKANLDRASFALTDLSVQGMGLNATGNINANEMLTKPSFSGDINIQPFDLRRTLQRLKQDLPDTADPQTLSRFALQTDFAGTDDQLALTNLAVGLDESLLTGDFAIEHFDAPAIRFGLDIDQINADRYLPPKPAGETPPPSPEAAAAAELPVEALRALNAKGDVHFGALQISGLRMQNVRLAIDAGGGRIKLDPLAGDLYDGQYQGRIDLDATGATTQLDMQADLRGTEVESLLTDLMAEPSSPLVGQTAFTLGVTASGNNSAQLKQAMDGQGTFAIRDGLYRGVDIPSVLTQVEVMLKSGRFGKVRKEGDTAFDELSGTFTIENGTVRSNDLVMLAPGFRVSGKGQVFDLSTEAIDYDMLVAVDPSTATSAEEQYDIGGYSIPIECETTLAKVSSLSCLPDVSKIAKAVGIRMVENKVLELLQGGEQQTAPDQVAPTPTPTPTEESGGNIGDQLLRRGLESIFKSR